MNKNILIIGDSFSQDLVNSIFQSDLKKFINVSGGNVKRLGKYNAQIRLHRDVSVELPFEIIAEKA